MIGFEYQGQVNYINRIEDFQDFMEPTVYEAVKEAFEKGCDSAGGLREKYEDLESDYEDLESDYEIVKDELDDVEDRLDDCEDRLNDCEEERDLLNDKYNTLKSQIKKLINDVYLEYAKLEEVIPALEKMV